jgi:hypothetical protein
VERRAADTTSCWWLIVAEHNFTKQRKCFPSLGKRNQGYWNKWNVWLKWWKQEMHAEFLWKNLAEDDKLDKEVEGRNARFWHLCATINMGIICGYYSQSWVFLNTTFQKRILFLYHQLWGRKCSYSRPLENIAMNLKELGHKNWFRSLGTLGLEALVLRIILPQI